MSKVKAVRRRYQMAGRGLAARATRAAIVRAARTLFSEHGFEATTVNSIASLAGVAPQTVYSIFGSKRAIASDFRSLLEEEAQIVERFQRAYAEADPARSLEHVARLARHIGQLHGDVYALFTQSRDPVLAAVGRELDGAQRDGTRRLVERYREQGALRRDLGPDDATTIVCGLASIELYSKLVTWGGWRPERFEAWLGRVLREQLLRPDD